MSNQPSTISHQRCEAAALLVIVAVWVLFFWLVFTPVEANRVQLEAGDFTLQFLAFWQFGLDEMRQGRWPLWLPCVDSGYPYFADPQAASFYPPALINWGAHLLSGSQTFSNGCVGTRGGADGLRLFARRSPIAAGGVDRRADV